MLIYYNISGGFYRHIYEQKLGSDKPEKDTTSEEKAEQDETSDIKTTQSEETSSTNSPFSKKRNYRKRRKSSHDINLSEGEIEDSDDEINRGHLSKKKSKPIENIDADSDFSIDESSDDEKNIKKEDPEPSSEDTFKKPDDVKVLKVENNQQELKSSETKTKDEEVKPKVDIWKKRTVGVVFEEALKRYYERKAARGS